VHEGLPMNSRLVDDVRSIAVLRPSAVGDFMFALPALHALKRAYPTARLIYLGRQWHADFLRERPGPVDEVRVLPPVPGIGAPPDADLAPARQLVERLRDERIDIAIQLYGGGLYSNPFVAALGARVTAGMKGDDAPPLDRWVSYTVLQNRRLQLLEVAGLLGATPGRLDDGLELCARDRDEAEPVRAAARGRPLVLIHPAASDPRRHWAPQRFAAVADRLADAGAVIAVNATAAEAAVAREVIRQMRHPALDLSGVLSLSGLCGVLAACALVISNDSGPLHLALALGVRCVGIYWLYNLVESGPLIQDRHRALMSTRIHCPVCGEENLKTRCPHDASFVDDVALDDVLQASLQLFERHREPG